MKNLYLLIVIISLSSCAGKYSEILPSKVNYENFDKGNGASISYKYDLIRINGNKKIAKRAIKKGIKVLAVKVSNDTDRPLVFGTDIKLYSDHRELLIMDHRDLFVSLKQIPPAYLLFLGLLPVNAYSEVNGLRKSFPIGLVLGPLLAISNTVMASQANSNMKEEFANGYLIGKEIKPGETVSGVIGLRQIEYAALSLRLVSQN